MTVTDKLGDRQVDERFASSGRTHVLMITNHGVHEWNVTPGMPDTGGQNVYVNQFTEALVAQGYRVTIANRGGYAHPATGGMQTGTVYHPSGHARIIYVEDGCPEFVRKEDMDEQLPRLAEDLARKLNGDGDTCDLIISHYWDAGKLGVMLNESAVTLVPHVWIPHSLGALKKRNMDPSTWANLRIDERIANERELLKSINGAVCTSSAIRDTFKNDYDYDARYFLPPCVDEVRYRPRSPGEVEPIWTYLSKQSGLSAADLKGRKIVTEISRTDKTKRKDVLIKAFARVKRDVPEALLLVSVDPHAEALYQSLIALIGELGLRDDVIVLGSIWDQLPLLYCATDVYCTPSVMEGFGMSVQEAAASGVPGVASNLVPFVCEYLVGKESKAIVCEGKDRIEQLQFGEGGVVVPADFVEGFAAALVKLLQDDELRERMSVRAREITVPYFTWRHLTESLLADLGVCATGENVMAEGFAVPQSSLSKTLVETWASQGLEGFLLTDPNSMDLPIKESADPSCGVDYRFRWMPHREIRGNVPELERRGILNPHRDESRLFSDPRDPQRRHCFLCADNIAVCHPMEQLVPMLLAGREYFAGANFAWIEPNHFTVMAADHVDQRYSRHVLEAMLDLHTQTAGQFRVLFNGPGAGATIPWHLHYQITTAPMPIEQLGAGRQDHYPTAVCRFSLETDRLRCAHAAAESWLRGDHESRSINILIATVESDPQVFVFPRDQRHASANGKGLVGGFEVAGDFVLSSPKERQTFDEASAAAARAILQQARPPDWTPCPPPACNTPAHMP